MTAPQRQPRPVVLLRPVPGRTAIHELWAGTKLLVVALIGVLLTLYPGWVPIVLVGVFVLFTARIAHIPRGVLPSVPRWLWFLLFLGALTASFAGGSPHLAVASVDVGLGGLFKFLQVTLLSIVLLGLGGLVSWTTNVAEIAPAVSKIGRPLRVLRLPIDDYAVALALALRAFPMLIDEFRVLFAARKLRPRDPATTAKERHRRLNREIVDLLAAAVTVALRRADEMGDAITARGGAGQISALPSRPTWADAVAGAAVLVLCAVSVVVEVFTPLATS
ncbi:energy-coupling factor transporter transmembrane protein EcfT [Mycobacterium hodleri]|uniref:energy-coupling factor transporter transmembrane component T family protein n=1 Tax=Mycolicibacterium hodleri TaxID=49897 RepID=UPI0021F3B024|nr:energy-coupling factor transporter transmembrane protein EcfT [Mycolicibacterium hodleri]MCV7137072.1 energy-coupling factor transporter transmembrane protein EcfT [Mycolicibacterium hodleri]